MRFLSHFRSVHRGAFFSEMKTTSIRKLLPENWWFICLVHTPDGHPCGLLNHLATTCGILSQGSLIEEHRDLSSLCVSFLILDGRVLGYISPENVNSLVADHRYLKIKQ